MFKGYLELDGVALINSEATEAYVSHLLPNTALRPNIRSQSIHIANEEAEYRTPLLDDAPWVNTLDPSSHDFLGLYPIDIEGLDDDELSADTVEYLDDGGSVGFQRRTSRSIRVTGILVGRTSLAVQTGRDWLAASLRSGNCEDCSDGTLRYFVAEPDVCETGAFGNEVSIATRAFGQLGTGVYRYRWNKDQVNPDMPARARWDATWAEGAAIRYAAAELEGTAEFETSPVVQPLRRNYMRNPTFRNTLADWSSFGSGSLQRRDTDGPSGGAYARLIADGALVPPAPGALGTGGLGTSGLGGAADVPPVTAVGSTLSIASGSVVASVASRGSAGGTLTVLSQGQVLASAAIPGSDSWVRSSLVTVAPTTGELTVQVATRGILDFDQIVVEQGSYALGGYFDGSSTEDGYLTSWEGGTDVSVARRTRVAPNEITRDSSGFRPTLEIVSGSASNVQLSWGVRIQQGMDDQLLPFERHLFDVGSTSGLRVLREVSAGAAGAYMQVEFELVAGNPAPYSLPEDIDTTPLLNQLYSDPQLDVAPIDLAWLTDPNAVVITLPPSAPAIVNPAIESVTAWRRYYVPIAASAVGDMAESVPTVAITSKDQPITQVRVRFHANPFGWAATAVDPLAYCSEFVLSYLPALTRLEVDGPLERAQASRGDQPLSSADHLLYGPNGGPIAWPKLSCAIPYLMTVDVPAGTSIDAFALEVSLRRKH